ncbi:MAG: universal stress protein [Bacteroidota bacterium]
MKDILVPVDFTSGSENALRYSLDLANSLRARLSLLHIIEEGDKEQNSPQDIVESYRTGNIPEAISILGKYVTKIQDDMGVSVDILFEIQTGKAENKISQYAEEIAADLIVMSTWWAKGLGGKIDQWKGNMATRVIEKTQRPVLLIPEHLNFSGFDHIVYATNFKESDQRVPKELLDLNKSTNLELSVVHVHRSGTLYGPIEFDYLNKLYRMEKGKVNVYFYTIHHEKVIDGLNSFINQEKGDVLAMLVHEKLSIFERLLGADIPKQMSFHSKVPLLILHEPHPCHTKTQHASLPRVPPPGSTCTQCRGLPSFDISPHSFTAHGIGRLTDLQ